MLLSSVSALASYFDNRSSCLKAVFRAAIAVGVIATVVKNGSCQQEVLDTLPEEPAVYLWTDDLANCASQFESILFPAFKTVFEFDSEQEESPDSDTVEKFRELWIQFLDGSLFRGDAVLVVWPGTVSEANEVRNIGTRFGLIVSISEDQKVIEEYFEAWESLLEDLGADTSASPIARTYVKDYLILSSGRSVGDHLKRVIEEGSGQPNRLVNTREFMSLKGITQSSDDSNANISLFVPSTALPSIGVAFAKESAYFHWLTPDDWDAYFLNEIRAFGGVVSLNHEGLSDQAADIQVGIHGRLQVTRPRRGPLQAFGKAEITRRDLATMPILDKPLSMLTLLKVDPSSVAKGSTEVLGRTHPNSNHSDSVGVDPYSLIDRWGMISYVDPEDARRAFYVTCCGASDPDAFIENYSRQNGAYVAPMDKEDLRESWPALARDEVTIWGDNPEWFANVVKDFQSSLDKATADLHEAEAMGDQEQIERAKKRMQLFAGQVKAYEQKRPAPRAAMLGPWYVNTQDLSLLPELGERFGKPHEQLLELFDDISRANRLFGKPTRIHGLMTWWPDNLTTRWQWFSLLTEMKKFRQRDLLPTSSTEGDADGDVVNRAPRLFKSCFIVVGDVEEGFDIKALLITPMVDGR